MLAGDSVSLLKVETCKKCMLGYTLHLRLNENSAILQA